eukprot:TRINITY_DN733_c0_g5_i1.p1 TRINITY_DN733_c0_g5~~TRINITY_DN733_c0_g5_i1.p1  ORF type:complete len:786 (-),score=146.08 TRINITY_DN733_c0_g5_i1:112-2469(-)
MYGTRTSLSSASSDFLCLPPYPKPCLEKKSATWEGLRVIRQHKFRLCSARSVERHLLCDGRDTSFGILEPTADEVAGSTSSSRVPRAVSSPGSFAMSTGAAAVPTNEGIKEQGSGDAQWRFRGVVVGGTFDRLHKGHELLLRSALALVAPGGVLAVGISTGPELLRRKVLYELIQPFENRRRAVEELLRPLAEASKVELALTAITKVAPERGATDPGLECIVVSEETQRGAESLNRARLANGVPPLQIIQVQTVAGEAQGASSSQEAVGEGEEGKLSSSQLRLACLGTFLDFGQSAPALTHPHHRRTAAVGPPYVVGLTGGIACGKSFVAELLAQKGADVLDCDRLAHRTYSPGTPTHGRLVEAFGTSILKPDGSVDRPVLGSLVFSNADAMSKLRAIVWPAVRLLMVEHFEAIAERGGSLCVAEAALMLEAGSERETHEVWVVFAGEEAARQRLMQRNGLTEAEANARINTQMASSERVSRADVALFNGGTREKMVAQVDKAWALLQERIRAVQAQWQEVQLLLSSGQAEHPLWGRWLSLMKRCGVDGRSKAALKAWTALSRNHRDQPQHKESDAEGQRRDGDREGAGDGGREAELCGLDVSQGMFQRLHEYFHFIEEPSAVQLALFFLPLSGTYDFPRFAAAANLDPVLTTNVAELMAKALYPCYASVAEANSSGGGGDAAWLHDVILLEMLYPNNHRLLEQRLTSWKAELSTQQTRSASLDAANDSDSEQLGLVLRRLQSRGQGVFQTRQLRDRFGIEFEAAIEKALASLHVNSTFGKSNDR